MPFAARCQVVFHRAIAATGGGDVIIQGTNSTSATTDALALGNMQIQASAGNISIDGGTQAVEFGTGRGQSMAEQVRWNLGVGCDDSGSDRLESVDSPSLRAI